jgi:glycosyltransferase involved in cell wall biosynthesis
VAHDRNTSPQAQFEYWWQTASARFIRSRYNATLRELASRLPAKPAHLGAGNVDEETELTLSVHNAHLPPRVRSDASAIPRISCLMITRDRGPQACNAVDCFQAQTHPDKELLIVTEHLEPSLAQHLAQIGNPRIRVLAVGDTGMTLGELRNYAIDHADGDFVCQWDDDDLYHPQRLSAQLKALLRCGADACFLNRWLIWWPGEQRLAISVPRFWEGSLLAWKSVMPRYPAVRRGEDTPAVAYLLQHSRVVSLDLPRLYIYIVHGGNTFGTMHFEKHWAAATERFSGREYAWSLSELAKSLPRGSLERLTQAE